MGFDLVSYVNLGGIKVVLRVPKEFEYKITTVEKKRAQQMMRLISCFSSGANSFEFRFFPNAMDDRESSLMLQIESLLLTAQEGSFHPAQPPFVDS